MAKTPEEIMADVLSVEAEAEAWDSEFSPNPHNPWAEATLLATEDAIPFLLQTLQGTDARRRGWALYAIEKLGPRVGSAIADHLESIDSPSLFFVDEERARRRGHARRAPHRLRFAQAMLERAPEETARHLAALLEDDDEEVLRFALGAGADDLRLWDLAHRHPDRIPARHVLQLLAHPAAAVRSAAATMLIALHLPEHADVVLGALVSGFVEVRPMFTEWLGSLPGSERVFTLDRGMQEMFEVVRRRRCAGLPTSLGGLAARLRSTLSAPTGSSRVSQNDVEYAARIVMETRDASYADALATAVGPPDGARPLEGDGPFEELREALAALGEAGRAAVDRARAAAPEGGRRHERLGWMRDALAKSKDARPYLTCAIGDQRFAEGNLEDPTLVDNAAYGAYARALLDDPRSAHAAFQLAWIDRGFGTPIDATRIEWLRELGVRDHLLGELATRPATIMPGYRFGHRPGSGYYDDRPGLARTAALAGLHGIAACYGADATSRSLARDAAAAHLELVRRACDPA